MTGGDRRALSPASRVERCATALCARIDGEVVALNIDKGICYGLDPIGSEIWDMIERPATVESLFTAMTDRYRVDAATCARDVTDWLTDMRDEGLVTVSTPEPTPNLRG